MKFPAFCYTAPETLPEALQVLSDDPEARPIAGGQSLLPLMAFRFAFPTQLVDLGNIKQLTEIRTEQGALHLGSMVTHYRNLTDETVAQACPILPEVVKNVAHTAVRSRGTIGGSLSHADAAAEMPFLMAVLDAKIVIAGLSGERVVAAREFVKGHYETAMEQGEILIRIEIPPSEKSWGFAEYARRAGDFALAMSAVGLRMESGVIAEAQIAIGAVEERPVFATDAEQMLVGVKPDDSQIALVAEKAVEKLEPRADLHGGAQLRLEIAKSVVERAIHNAIEGGK
ncbi:MAG: molybdopterin dehydrogenase [Alcaligenaceae bacterium]|nr:molybdopterin dehydrogenase [Alcaligenaceae bacterium]